MLHIVGVFVSMMVLMFALKHISPRRTGDAGSDRGIALRRKPGGSGRSAAVVMAFGVGESCVARNAAVTLNAVEMVAEVFSGRLLVEWGFIEVGVVVVTKVLVGFVCGATSTTS